MNSNINNHSAMTKDIPEIEILWKSENFHFLHILFASHKTTVIFLPFFSQL